MTASPALFTVTFNDADLDPEERDEEAQKLLNQMADLDGVEAQRAADPAPPEKSKAFLGMLVGVLTAEVSIANAKELLSFLGDRLSGKTIELKVEAEGRTLEVSASSRAELEAAVEMAKEFLAAEGSPS